MSKTLSFPTPRSVTATSSAAGAAIAVVLAVLGGRAISAQDKYTVQVPNGLAFSEFRGFEDWPTVAVSQTGDLIEVIVATLQRATHDEGSAPPRYTHFRVSGRSLR